MRRKTRAAGWKVGDNGLDFGAFRNERRPHFLQDRQRVLPSGVVFRHRSFLSHVVFSDGGAAAVGVQGGPGLRDAPFDDGEVASIGGDVSQGDAQPFPAAG